MSMKTRSQPLQQGTTMEQLSVFQIRTEENPGIAVEYGDLENSSNRSFLKIDALPISYTCVKNFLAPF